MQWKEGGRESGKISFHIRAETSPQQAATICLSIKGKLGMVLAGFTLLVLILELVGFRQIGRMGSDLLNAIQTYYPKNEAQELEINTNGIGFAEPGTTMAGSDRKELSSAPKNQRLPLNQKQHTSGIKGSD
ncbi:MAG: hypothetical protein BMS9Abin06_1198 [Gammaproteobacteria bacterium]|nr:MAG: hypothetical protein BMS9Abin06_1198 [Gammaproteobacteria bacterium]